MATATLKEAAPAMKREQRNFMSEYIELCNRSTTRGMTAFDKEVSTLSLQRSTSCKNKIEWRSSGQFACTQIRIRSSYGYRDRFLSKGLSAS